MRAGDTAKARFNLPRDYRTEGPQLNLKRFSFRRSSDTTRCQDKCKAENNGAARTKRARNSTSEEIKI
jgi:hypothetical protein